MATDGTAPAVVCCRVMVDSVGLCACAVRTDRPPLLCCYLRCKLRCLQLLDAESFTGVGDHTRVGSPLFMAPEILLREDYGPQVVSLKQQAGKKFGQGCGVCFFLESD